MTLTDLAQEKDLGNDWPLLEVCKAPLLSIDEAIMTCKDAMGLVGDDEVAAMLACAKRKARRVLKTYPNEVLTADDIAAVNFYSQGGQFVFTLNQLLRTRSRKKLKPALAYLKLLLSALHKLPPERDTVYSGVHGVDLVEAYPKQWELVWWGITSTTTSIGEIPKFHDGPRTLFSIKAQTVDIQRYCAFSETTRVVLPGTQLLVKDTLGMGNGLTMVQLEEMVDEPSLLVGFKWSAAADGGGGATTQRDSEQMGTLAHVGLTVGGLALAHVGLALAVFALAYVIALGASWSR